VGGKKMIRIWLLWFKYKLMVFPYRIMVEGKEWRGTEDLSIRKAIG
jgi:hypothetical protein